MARSTFKPFAVAMLAALASAVHADPPPAAPAAPAAKAEPATWARRATKDLPPNRQGGKNDQRDAGVSEAALFFIAPRTTGLTTRELPDVYWYISPKTTADPTYKEVTFKIVDDPSKKTLLRLVLKDVQPGFHRIELAREAKAAKFAGFEANDFDPAKAQAGGGGAAQLKREYRMSLSSSDPKLLAVAYIARVRGGTGQDPNDYAVQIRNELWYDAVGALAASVNGEPKRAEAPRKALGQMLSAEEVLRSAVADDAPEANRSKARAVEDDVLKRLSVPDPIDLQSAKDHWVPKSVPDPIDLNSFGEDEKPAGK
jgi:hypothetical protein